MKLWNQNFAALERLPAFAAAMKEHYARVGEPATRVDLYGLDPAAYRTDYPGSDIRYQYLQRLHSLQFVRNARRAEREGYDGFMLTNLPEPMLDEIRSVVDIPVVGYCEAALHVGGMLGRRIAILAMISQLVPLYEQHVVRHGYSNKVWGVTPLGMTFEQIVAGFESPAPVVEHFTTLVRSLAKQGVDVVIPGEAPVAAVLAHAGLWRVDDVPLVDALGATLKTAEMMVTLRQRSAMRVARAGYFSDRVPEGRLDEIERFYGLDEPRRPESP